MTKVVKEVTEEEKARELRVQNRPPLLECLNLHDFEVRDVYPYDLLCFI